MHLLPPEEHGLLKTGIPPENTPDGIYIIYLGHVWVAALVSNGMLVEMDQAPHYHVALRPIDCYINDPENGLKDTYPKERLREFKERLKDNDTGARMGKKKQFHDHAFYLRLDSCTYALDYDKANALTNSRDPEGKMVFDEFTI